MRRSSRRLLILLGSVPVLLFAYALLYKLGMEHLEGKHRTVNQAVEFVAESMTTTGYGSDSQWEHPAMLTLVVIIQFSGLSLTLLAFPVFLVPYMAERFEARIPQVLPPMRGTILVYRWGPAVAPLVERLEHLNVPVVILEENLALARRLIERGHEVVQAQIEEEELDLAPIAGMRGVVVAGDDPGNAALTLMLRQQGYTGPIAALVATPARRSAMQRAGATAVFTPGHVLAAAVAARASEKISPRVSGAQTIGRHLQIREVRIDRASPLAGKTLVESSLRAKTGVTIVGWWRDGELRPPPGPSEKVDVGSILVAAGADAGIEKLGELATPVARTGATVVIGKDEVAHKVVEFLEGAEEEVRVLVDGDPLDPEVLKRAGVREARAVILSLETDGETLFAAAVVRDLAPEALIIAAARRAENVGRIRRAGADFALSVGQVAGQLLAFQLLGEDTVALEAEIKLVRAQAGELAGVKLAAAQIRERTGCSVVAIDRGEDVIAELGSDFEVRHGDDLYISGGSGDIDRFFAAFPGTHPDG